MEQNTWRIRVTKMMHFTPLMFAIILQRVSIFHVETTLFPLIEIFYRLASDLD